LRVKVSGNLVPRVEILLDRLFVVHGRPYGSPSMTYVSCRVGKMMPEE
jgi:hypothetical protein